MSEKIFKKVEKKSGEIVLQKPRMDSKPGCIPESLHQLKIQILTSHLEFFTSVIKLVVLTIQISCLSKLNFLLHCVHFQIQEVWGVALRPKMGTEKLNWSLEKNSLYDQSGFHIKC